MELNKTQALQNKNMQASIDSLNAARNEFQTKHAEMQREILNVSVVPVVCQFITPLQERHRIEQLEHANEDLKKGIVRIIQVR